MTSDRESRDGTFLKVGTQNNLIHFLINCGLNLFLINDLDLIPKTMMLGMYDPKVARIAPVKPMSQK